MSGTRISLADIQNHVLVHWRDPIVIYGFYMGAVGTSNIRTTAYTSENVYDELYENAVDFVNSMRGTQVWQNTELRVSTYYHRMDKAFPNFEPDVEADIRTYAKGKLKRQIVAVITVSAEIADWHIAGLYNGRPFSEPAGGAFARITLSADGNPFNFKLPAHAVQLLRDRQNKLYHLRRDRGSTVDMEKLPIEKQL